MLTVSWSLVSQLTKTHTYLMTVLCHCLTYTDVDCPEIKHRKKQEQCLYDNADSSWEDVSWWYPHNAPPGIYKVWICHTLHDRRIIHTGLDLGMPGTDLSPWQAIYFHDWMQVISISWWYPHNEPPGIYKVWICHTHRDRRNGLAKGMPGIQVDTAAHIYTIRKLCYTS